MPSNNTDVISEIRKQMFDLRDKYPTMLFIHQQLLSRLVNENWYSCNKSIPIEVYGLRVIVDNGLSPNGFSLGFPEVKVD